MLFNLHILPLLGGFLFITFWNRTRLVALRYEGQRLIFNSAICGLVFTIISILILRIPILNSFLESIIFFLFEPYFREVDGFQVDIIAFFLEVLLVFPLNQYIFSIDTESLNAIKKTGSQLEKKIMQSLKVDKPILVVLKNRKYYVGYIAEGIDLSGDRTFFTIFPLFSGYQDAITLRHYQQFDYESLYRGLMGKGVTSKNKDEFTNAYDSTICIRTDDVVTIRTFEPDLKIELDRPSPDTANST